MLLVFVTQLQNYWHAIGLVRTLFLFERLTCFVLDLVDRSSLRPSASIKLLFIASYTGKQVFSSKCYEALILHHAEHCIIGLTAFAACYLTFCCDTALAH